MCIKLRNTYSISHQHHLHAACSDSHYVDSQQVCSLLQCSGGHTSILDQLQLHKRHCSVPQHLIDRCQLHLRQKGIWWHWKLKMEIHQAWQLPANSLVAEKPSCLQATLASERVHVLSQIVSHVWLKQISTRPLYRSVPLMRRISESLQTPVHNNISQYYMGMLSHCISTSITFFWERDCINLASYELVKKVIASSILLLATVAVHKTVRNMRSRLQASMVQVSYNYFCCTFYRKSAQEVATVTCNRPIARDVINDIISSCQPSWRTCNHYSCYSVASEGKQPWIFVLFLDVASILMETRGVSFSRPLAEAAREPRNWAERRRERAVDHHASSYLACSGHLSLVSYVSVGKPSTL